MERVKSDHELKEDNIKGGSDAEAPAPAPGVPEKPSIAILPFVNLSGDPANDMLTVGLTDDISIALGREKWLFVVAGPRSAATLQEAETDPGAFADRLGVRYLLRAAVCGGAAGAPVSQSSSRMLGQAASSRRISSRTSLTTSS